MTRLKIPCSPSMATKRQRDQRINQNDRASAKIAFIESKKPNLDYVATLLAECERYNHWANRGPLYWTLAEYYQTHMHLPSDMSVTPCANAGVALEALARFHDIKAGRPHRWVGSAFSFSNLGRGYFAAMQFVDCDDHGMLDLSALKAIDPSDYDGFIVTNIFGVWRDFSPYIEFAQTSGKVMLIDNAAGLDEHVPDWPYQCFSLHHTKPYGAGEGGLMLSPRDDAEGLYQLLDYGAIPENGRNDWMNNGKLSDIACAFHLDRLAQYPNWAPLYRDQAMRVGAIAAKLGLRPLVPLETRPVPATSYPFVAPKTAPLERLQKSERLTFGKYYKPLADTPKAAGLYRTLVNVPTHPDVARLSEDELAGELERFVLG